MEQDGCQSLTAASQLKLKYQAFERTAARSRQCPGSSPAVIVVLEGERSTMQSFAKPPGAWMSAQDSALESLGTQLSNAPLLPVVRAPEPLRESIARRWLFQKVAFKGCWRGSRARTTASSGTFESL